MSTTPNSIVTPQTMVSSQAVCTAAKTTYGDGVNAVRLVHAADNPNGALVKNLFAIPRGNVQATEIQLYRSPDAGTTFNYVDSALMSAYSISQSAQTPKTYFGPSSTTPYSDAVPLRLRAGEELWVGVGVAIAAGIMVGAEFEAY